jgi:hypothetical protein
VSAAVLHRHGRFGAFQGRQVGAQPLGQVGGEFPQGGPVALVPERGDGFAGAAETTWPVEDGTVEALVVQTGKPARSTDYPPADTEISAWTRAHGIKYFVICPVMIEGRM